MKKLAKTKVLLILLILTAAIVPLMTFSAFAADSSDYVEITKNDSFTKDGKFNMSFTIENLQKPVDIGGLLIGEVLLIDARVVNSAGKKVQSWSRLSLDAGKKGTWNFGTDFSELPSGQYTFKLAVSAILAEEDWEWAYGITHKLPESSVSYQSYETYYDQDGRYMHKVSLHCKNMKGHRLFCKIYNEDGDLMVDWGTTTALRKTNDEVPFLPGAATRAV